MGIHWILLLWTLLGNALGASTVELRQWRFGPAESCEGPPPRAADLPYAGTFPATVLGGLMQNGKYGDVLQGFNLRTVDASPFRTPWWFAAGLPAADAPSLLMLDGVNYRAELFVGGKSLGPVVGTFAHHERVLPATNTHTSRGRTYSGADNNATAEIECAADSAAEGEEEEVALCVYPVHDAVFPPDNNSTDLALTWVDWAPPPPDNAMGIYQRAAVVAADAAAPVVLRYLRVQTDALTPQGDRAFLSVVVRVVCLGAASGAVVVDVGAGVGSLSQPFSCPAAGAEALVAFRSSQFHALHILDPQLWWPWQMGAQPLFNASARFVVDGSGASSAPAATRFGIRLVMASLTSDGYLSFSFNYRPLLVLGAGWAPDLFLRDTPEAFAASLAYVKHMNLNTVRLEGKFPSDAFFDAADAAGVVVLPGWCCCDAWQHWPAWGPEQFAVANASMRSQLLRLAPHASVAVFMYGSDVNPPPDVEEMYLSVATSTMWPNSLVASAAADVSNITGPTGVKMSGPYAWVPPEYWVEGARTQQLGGAFSFLTEGGPGAAVMPLESMLKVAPLADLDGIVGNAMMDYHTCNPQGLFHNLRFFNPALVARYGEPRSVADYFRKSQASAYEAIRAMYEAYSGNKYTSTGVVQWMLNSAWPSNYWNLYDFFLNAGGGFYGARKACEELHVSYPAIALPPAVQLVTSSARAWDKLTVSTEVRALNGSVLWSAVQRGVAIGPDAVARMIEVPGDAAGAEPMYFLRLRVTDIADREISENVYWLSAQPDVLNWTDSTFYITHCTRYADLTALQHMPDPAIAASVSAANATHVSVGGLIATAGVAFQVRLRLLASSADALSDVLPSFWSDNYVTLFPGEPGRTLSVEIPPGAAPPLTSSAVVRVEHYNSDQYMDLPVFP